MPHENESDTFEITGEEAPKTGNEDVTKEEKDAVKAISKQYEAARKFDHDSRKQYAVDRGYASGKVGKRWASNANLIGSFIDILTSFLYAKNPDVSTLAAKNVGGSNQNNVDFAETLGIVITRLWKTGKLKMKARKSVRSSLSVGPGWLKVIMTHETRKDPVIQAQLNDLEDNVARLNAAQLILEEGELDEEQTNVQIQDIQQQQDALKAKLEIKFRFGLGIDFVQAEDMQVGLSVSDTIDYLDADWNANEIYILTDDLRIKFPRLTDEDIQSADKYFQRKQTTPTEEDSTGEIELGFTAKDTSRFTKSQPTDGDDPSFARVVEFWDNRDNHVKTFAIGMNKWCIEPYLPPYATTRFYPYFRIAFFEVDGERHPQSLSSRLEQLQDEYSSKRSNSRLTAERSVPGTIFDSTGITKKDMQKIERSVHQEFVGINPTKGDDIRKLFAEKPVAKMDPAVFDTRSVLSDMERVAGVQEALSQSVQTAKTATEAKIQQTGFTSRTSADRDTLEDTLEDLAIYTAELSIQALPTEFVQRLAGEKAFWPEGMDVEDLLTLSEVELDAGSTGKPDEEALRQSWQILLPLAQNAIAGIQEAQLTGNVPLAEAIRNLIKETMRRLDERIDVDQFIPTGPLQAINPAGLPPGSSAIIPQVGGPAVSAEQAAADGNTLV